MSDNIRTSLYAAEYDARLVSQGQRCPRRAGANRRKALREWGYRGARHLGVR